MLNMCVPRKNMRALLPAPAGSICSAGKMPMGNLAHFTATEPPAFQGLMTTVCGELDFYTKPSTEPHMGLLTLDHTWWCSRVIKQMLLG